MGSRSFPKVMQQEDVLATLFIVRSNLKRDGHPLRSSNLFAKASMNNGIAPSCNGIVFHRLKLIQMQTQHHVQRRLNGRVQCHTKGSSLLRVCRITGGQQNLAILSNGIADVGRVAWCKTREGEGIWLQPRSLHRCHCIHHQLVGKEGHKHESNHSRHTHGL